MQCIKAKRWQEHFDLLTLVKPHIPYTPSDVNRFLYNRNTLHIKVNSGHHDQNVYLLQTLCLTSAVKGMNFTANVS